MRLNLYNENNLHILPHLPDNSVDAVVTDPPYGLSFMGSKWDADVPSAETWAHVLRVLKPGGHLLAFFGTRTYHRGVVAIEDAGFEIRDMVSYNFGSGFPKALDVSKAIDKLKGKEREKQPNPKAKQQTASINTIDYGDYNATTHIAPIPATPEAAEWDGWKTALKPAFEPICLARKPFKGTVAENVLEHGTGALNVDGCRVGDEKRFNAASGNKKGMPVYKMGKYGMPQNNNKYQASGRYPANTIFDEEAAAALDEQSGERKTGALSPDTNIKAKSRLFGHENKHPIPFKSADSGGASRYFNRCNYTEGDVASFYYCAKTSTKERDAGLPKQTNLHPTVKPVQLMRHLVRLITPPGGLVLDPFMGSGSTGMAAALEDCGFIGIEMSEEYFAWAEARIAYARDNPAAFDKKQKQTKKRPARPKKQAATPQIEEMQKSLFNE